MGYYGGRLSLRMGQELRGSDMVKGRAKTDRILLLWGVLTFLWNHLSYYLHISYIETISYTALILFWVYSLKDELPDAYIRRTMRLGGLLLTLLFLFRFIRYNLVAAYSFSDHLMRYGYYIPTIITPLLSLMISLAIGGGNREKRRLTLPVLWIACALLLLLVFTNDLHHLVIRFRYEGDQETSSVGILYYLIIVWYVALMLAAFIITYRKCLLSSYKIHWKLPLVFEAIGLILWLWYYLICGGSSPKLNGVPLYNIQEVYVLLFIGLWESLIAIGLIPSVSLARDRAWISEGVLDTVGGEVAELKDILDGIRDADDDHFRNGLIRITFIGTYIKRRANLELLPAKTGLLSTMELTLVIRETLEFFDFSRISAGYEESGEAVDVPPLLISGIFELLKNIIWRTVSACFVKLTTGRTDTAVSVTLTVEADMDLSDAARAGEHVSFAALADTALFDALGAEYSLYEEDDTWQVRLYYAGPARLSPHSGLFSSANGYGLSQIASYLYLEKEVLAARTRIHDNLGRCLLMTKAYLLDRGSVTRKMITSEWDRMIAEMSGNAPAEDRVPEGPDADPAYFIQKAESMGVDVRITGEIPGQDRIREILNTALSVHVTNIIKHSTGKTACVDIASGDGEVVITLTDDGDCPSEEIVEKGGLKNLRQRVEEAGGSMKLAWKDGFRLTLILPA